ncbi:MAG TPA: hypothetical protein PKI99_09960 [Terrimesophilobacter sp.]|nr:hypothetical protein [Terrimesophilobacter sp.]HNP16777.1 hypothetical protein [Terrimesophilobacter sp.]
MCGPARCRVCGKTTWSGCGQHIQEVRRSVPAANWCGGNHTQAQIDESKANSTGFLSRLFSRG